MTTKTHRSEETIKKIIHAAEILFSKDGYDAVTIRQIAKYAGCSHTTIYLYFKDKEALLHTITVPSLEKLYEQLSQLSHANEAPLEKLKNISRTYLHFGLKNKDKYELLMNVKGTKVDKTEPESEVNKLRIAIFNILKEIIGQCLPDTNPEVLLAFTRVYYYNLNGIFTTYSYMHEPLPELMERLAPTFELSTEALILGFKEIIVQGGETNENQSNF